MPDAPRESLQWQAYEHEHIERSSEWFWALGIIAVSAAIISILFDDYYFAILILIAAFVIGLLARQPREMHEFEISDKGIRTNNELHSYAEILAFWVDDGPQPLLLIDTTKFMAPNLVIPIGDTPPDEVRALLRHYVDEVPMKEPFAHKVMEFFGL